MSDPHATGSRAAIIEHVARAMWNTRYTKYLWDGEDDSAYDRPAKKEGFRRTAAAAIDAVREWDAEMARDVHDYDAAKAGGGEMLSSAEMRAALELDDE